MTAIDRVRVLTDISSFDAFILCNGNGSRGSIHTAAQQVANRGYPLGVGVSGHNTESLNVDHTR